MQAQATRPPYFALWARLERFEPRQLATLLIDRRAVRIALLRSTLHVVTADDALAWRRLLEPMMRRQFLGSHGRHLGGADLDALTRLSREHLEREPLTFAELGAWLHTRWPGAVPGSLAAGARTTLALIQRPPYGVWGESGQPTHTLLSTWLGRECEDPSPHGLEHLVRRGLAAWGPASAADLQTWCGLSGLGTVLKRLRPALATFTDERGRELFDLPDAPRPDPDVEAPARFLGEFDNMLLSYKDPSRVVSPEDRKRVITSNGLVRGTFTVDGFVHGQWQFDETKKGERSLSVEAFRPLSPLARAALVNEGQALLRFATTGADARPGDVRFTTKR